MSECVYPSFDYRDRDLGKADVLRALYPQHWSAIAPYVHAHEMAMPEADPEFAHLQTASSASTSVVTSASPNSQNNGLVQSKL